MRNLTAKDDIVNIDRTRLRLISEVFFETKLSFLSFAEEYRNVSIIVSRRTIRKFLSANSRYF